MLKRPPFCPPFRICIKLLSHGVFQWWQAGAEADDNKSFLFYDGGQDVHQIRWPHAIRIHLKNLDFVARAIHPEPDPSDAGTKHLSQGRFSINVQRRQNLFQNQMAHSWI